MTNKILFLFLISFLLRPLEVVLANEADAPSQNYFEGLQGCFLLFNMKTGAFDKVIGKDVCQEQFPACSTFKVPLAVMAFDSGVLKDENEVLKWDGVKDARSEVNHDHNAKTWMRDSVVWFSQRITPKLGEARFQKYLNAFNYGNKDITAGITTAWLVSPSAKTPALKISAYEQVEFMKKLWTDSLPVSKRAMKLTREITFLEKSPKGYEVSGKTGSSFDDDNRKIQFGWFIAHLKSADQEYIVVTNLRDLKPTQSKRYGGLRAKALTKEILAHEGRW
jgi:beta-lactamase class D